MSAVKASKETSISMISSKTLLHFSFLKSNHNPKIPLPIHRTLSLVISWTSTALPHNPSQRSILSSMLPTRTFRPLSARR